MFPKTRKFAFNYFILRISMTVLVLMRMISGKRGAIQIWVLSGFVLATAVFAKPCV